MNKKSLVKFAHNEDKAFMHYVVFNGEVVVLSRFDSKKVTHIEAHGSVEVSFDVDSSGYDVLKAEVVADPVYVEKVYNYMIETNNAYFKDGIEGLCVIKLSK